MRTKLEIFFYFFLILWIGGISYGLTLMHSWHYADLSTELTQVNILKKALPNVEELGVVHFITPGCGCSQIITEHLLERGPLVDRKNQELIVLVDDFTQEMSKKFRVKGFVIFDIHTPSMNDELRNSIQGVPLLLIYDENKKTKYIGGYSTQAITPFSNIDIKSFLIKIRESRSIASMPVIGCTTSEKYKALLDPLGLKYEKREK